MNLGSILPPHITPFAKASHSFGGQYSDYGEAIWGFEWDPSGRFLAAMGTGDNFSDGGPFLWDLQTRQWYDDSLPSAFWDAVFGDEFTMYPKHECLWCDKIQWKPDGPELETEYRIKFRGEEQPQYYKVKWSPQRKPEAFQILKKYQEAVWSPDGKTLAVQWGNGVELTRNSDFTVIKKEPEELLSFPETGKLYGWSPDGRWLVQFAPKEKPKAITLKDVETGLEQCIAPNLEKYQIEDIAWSPDGSILAIACDRQVIQVWNVDSSTRLLVSLDTKEEHARSVSFSGDGRLMAVMSIAANCRTDRDAPAAVDIWRCDTWQLVAHMPITTNAIGKDPFGYPRLRFNPKEYILATSRCDDWQIEFWKIAPEILDKL